MTERPIMFVRLHDGDVINVRTIRSMCKRLLTEEPEYGELMDKTILGMLKQQPYMIVFDGIERDRDEHCVRRTLTEDDHANVLRAMETWGLL